MLRGKVIQRRQINRLISAVEVASINSAPLGFSLYRLLIQMRMVNSALVKLNPFLDIDFLIFDKSMYQLFFVDIRESVIVEAISGSVEPRAGTLRSALRPAHCWALWLGQRTPLLLAH